jgi:HAMP domain-containing protein
LLITANTPVYDGDTYLGILGIDLSITRLVATIDQVSPTEFGFAFYIDNNGKLLEASPSTQFRKSWREERAASRRHAGHAARWEIRRPDHGKRARHVRRLLTASRRRRQPRRRRFRGRLTAQASAITASIDRESSRTLTITLLAMRRSLVGLAGETWLNRRFILQPIEALVDGTRRVARGDLNTTIPVTSDDELGILATSFNTMTGEMRGRRDALEREVEERTEAQDELRALFAAMTERVIVLDRDGNHIRTVETNTPEAVRTLRARRRCLVTAQPLGSRDRRDGGLRQAIDE